MSSRPAYLAAAVTAAVLLAWGAAGTMQAGAQGAAPGRQPFQQLLLVPPDDRDYVVTRIQPGARVVVTDVIAYNVADARARRVAPDAESYLWLGGYVDGKSVGLVNRMRLLGNETQQWHLQTGFELRSAPELVVSSEKGAANATPSLVYVTGYVER